MMGRTHATIGAATCLTAAAILDTRPAVAATTGAIAAITALLPDLDHPHALATRWPGRAARRHWRRAQRHHRRNRPLPMLATASTAAGLAVLAVAARSASWILTRTLGHRGGTHSLAAVTAVAAGTTGCAVLAGWPWWVPAAATIGYASHVLADACTRTGCPLGWPVTARMWSPLPHRWRITTGQAVERWAVAPASWTAAVAAAWVILT